MRQALDLAVIVQVFAPEGGRLLWVGGDPLDTPITARLVRVMFASHHFDLLVRGRAGASKPASRARRA
mgnify:FL=1